MSTSESCKDSASKSSDVGVCEVNDMLQNMSTVDTDNIVSVCANCGKQCSSDNMNICNKCKQAKYCNAACKKKHRSKHKKTCERRVAELHDEKLFKQPPPKEDCPICFLLMPILGTGWRYYNCCGKTICSGCVYAPIYDDRGNEVDNEKCPFCRAPWPSSDDEIIKRYEKRMNAGDAKVYNQGNWYKDGMKGFPRNYGKALELYHRSGELGYSEAYCSIGATYEHGYGVEIDKKKATHYYELAAMRGNVIARHNLGANEGSAGNLDRAIKHHMVAVKDGYVHSLNIIKDLYSKGIAKKEDYTKALQLYQSYLDEIKSVQRDKAAAADDDYRYY